MKPRTNRSQFSCPQCGKHKIVVRDTVAKRGQTIERYRFCEACQHAFKTRETVVSDYRELRKLSVASCQLSKFLPSGN